jgi:hypothetical protein
MPAAADDDVVVQSDADRGHRLAHRARHVDIGLGRRRVAGGVIVHHQKANLKALISLETRFVG